MCDSEDERRPPEIEADDSSPLLLHESEGDQRRSYTQESHSASPRTTTADATSNVVRVRQPVQYRCVPQFSSKTYNTIPLNNSAVSAMLNRYKYYNKLSGHADNRLHMPEHVVPPQFFTTVLVHTQGEQSSLVTIFSLWNTMMGTSILSLPWALKEAGFAFGIILVVAMTGLMLYTSYRVMRSMDHLPCQSSSVLEFSDACRYYLGKWGERSSIVFSLIALIGGLIVYWILMSNFLFNTVSFIYKETNHLTNLSLSHNVICRNHGAKNINTTLNFMLETHGNKTSDSQMVLFKKIWSEDKTVPFFLLIFIIPLISLKSPTFFTKFNTLATMSVMYLMVFVTVKAAMWGVNINFSHRDQLHFSENFKITFPALTGVSALALFIHNCVISVVRNQKQPEHNARDLIIAYCLVATTYLYIGILVYVTFPLPKDCIEDNFLNNLKEGDIFAVVARISLLFQMMCVFPLLAYVFRVQLLHALFGSIWPSFKHVLFLNIILSSICILFACFVPHIGKVISFVGAFCGFAYALGLPCLVYVMTCREQGNLTWLNLTFHIVIVSLGLANFIAQFFLIGSAG